MKTRPHKWNDHHPIYLQLINELIGGILERRYPEGEMLPSVRQLAETYDVNPLTAAKAYKELARDGLIETVRGEGLVVKAGARASLLKRERARFLKEEWPGLQKRLLRMELDLKTLYPAE
jgi:GntR family transcriptional regulator